MVHISSKNNQISDLVRIWHYRQNYTQKNQSLLNNIHFMLFCKGAYSGKPQFTKNCHPVNNSDGPFCRQNAAYANQIEHFCKICAMLRKCHMFSIFKKIGRLSAVSALKAPSERLSCFIYFKNKSGHIKTDNS